MSVVVELIFDCLFYLFNNLLQQPDVRLKCVLGLQALYQDQSSSKMDLFTIRFKVTIASTLSQMTHYTLCTMYRVVNEF